MSEECTIVGCTSRRSARLMCDKHYKRWWRHGQAAAMLRAEDGLPQYWLELVATNADTVACIVWPFGDSSSYGTVSTIGGRVGAHRQILALTGVRVPDGSTVCHRCDNPPCVNPRHLYVGSAATNAADRVRSNRQAKGDAISTSKLSAEDVLAIRREIRDGGRQVDLARRFGVSRQSIRRIVTGKTWGWLQ